MIEAVVIEQAAKNHQKNLTHILGDCVKEVEVAHKSYTAAHNSNQRTLEVSKRDAAKKKEDRSYARTFDIRQKEYEDAMASSETLFQHSEARMEDEFSVAMKSLLTRYNLQVALEVSSFISSISV